MKGLTKEEEILRQVKLAKRSQFGVTAVKIEMEGVFQRRGTGGRADSDCEKCHGNGTIRHEACSGNGYTGQRPDYYNPYPLDNTFKACMGCDLHGSQICPNCFDQLKAWGSVTYCQQWLLRQLHELGLSTKKRDGTYVPKGALKFAYFYADPSVDSEFTFTLSLKDPNSIFMLPQIIALWKKLGEEIGNGLSIQNAGMHMALIRTADCVYPSENEPNDNIRLRNMEKSMRMLMPALFFLGSDTSHSRGMRFRIPRVSTDKYSAVHFGGGALEFRVFETCYDNPERVLDNFVVMRNCLRFWSDKYHDPNLGRIAQSIKFGNDSNQNLSRLYSTTTHLDLLNAGLTKLKPAYCTLKELKEQRGFDINKRKFTQMIKELRKNAAARYSGYRSQQLWSAEVTGKRRALDNLSVRSAPSTEEGRTELITEAERIAADAVEHARNQILDETAYVDRQVTEHNNNNGGQYSLTAV